MKLCRSKAEEESILSYDDDNAATTWFHRSTWLIIKLFDYLDFCGDFEKFQIFFVKLFTIIKICDIIKKVTAYLRTCPHRNYVRILITSAFPLLAARSARRCLNMILPD